MSEVTVLLSSRVVVGVGLAAWRDGVGAVARPQPDQVTPALSSTLAELAIGTQARVTGFSTDLPGEAARRLFDLGFTPGARVSVVRKAPLRDPIVFRVADYDIALRRAQAGRILVAGMT